MFLFQFRKEKNRKRPGLGCMEDLSMHGPFQTSETVLQLRICGLKHCHVINGLVGDPFSDLLFSFLFAFL